MDCLFLHHENCFLLCRGTLFHGWGRKFSPQRFYPGTVTLTAHIRKKHSQLGKVSSVPGWEQKKAFCIGVKAGQLSLETGQLYSYTQYRVAAINPEHFQSFAVALKNHIFY
jgi:hypothetical protein